MSWPPKHIYNFVYTLSTDEADTGRKDGPQGDIQSAKESLIALSQEQGIQMQFYFCLEFVFQFICSAKETSQFTASFYNYSIYCWLELIFWRV